MGVGVQHIAMRLYLLSPLSIISKTEGAVKYALGAQIKQALFTDDFA
ncbi:unnamed protein product [marine sediment metagenome]|uniref:Uncharacterized protein n=1 Tax=marine sediment metagenome TaxID=412755 RepID=X1QGK4_9ZZZZ